MEWPLPGSPALPAHVRAAAAAHRAACPETELQVHQRVIAQFLAPGSPHRGLLVVHGLGSGKTLSAAAVVAAAAGGPALAWVLLPSALRSNFMAELRKPAAIAEFECGKWARARDGTWSRARGGVRVKDLPSADRAAVSQHVASTAADSVRFLSINGLTRRRLADLEAAPSNPFDGAVVVIDECHTLIGAVANSAGQDAKLPRRLYDLLMAARRVKLVLLSATPLINDPVELAYLVNLVRGPLTEHRLRWSKPLRSGAADAARAALLEVPFVLSADVTPAGAAVTFAPEGFVVSDRARGTVRGSAGNAAKAALAAVAPWTSKAPAFESETYDALPPATFADTFLRDGVVVRESLLMTRMRGVASFFARKTDDARYPTASYHVRHVPMSDTQLVAYGAARRAERELESQRVNKDGPSVYLSYSRAVLNFVYPGKETRKELRARLPPDGGLHDVESALAEGLRKLKRAPLWRDDSALAEHSPKYAAILAALAAQSGLAMMYSGFREVEGLGLMANLLLARGWRRLDVERGSDRVGRFVLHGTGSGPAFVMPTLATADGDDQVSLFNSEPLSDAMAASARRAFGVPDLDRLDNSRGALVKLVMLSPSGAKGLNLKCVRSVHILEPHWHSTLMEQVAGRAVRMDSHAALPVDERTVSITTYASTFTDAQRSSPGFSVFARSDRGLTTDEILLSIAARKQRTLDALTRLLARTAIDCGLSGADGARCYEPPTAFGVDAPDIRRAADVRRKKGSRHSIALRRGAVEVTVRGGRVYAHGRHVGDVTAAGDRVRWLAGEPDPDTRRAAPH